MFAGTGFFSIPALKTVYMGGGTVRFSSRDNFQSQHNIVPAKRDGVFI